MISPFFDVLDVKFKHYSENKGVGFVCWFLINVDYFVSMIHIQYCLLFFSTPGMRKALSASKGLNRVHFFISKTVIKPETCTPVSIHRKLYLPVKV